MDGFLKIVKDKVISFEYYGSQDIATGIELKNIIEEKVAFEQLFDDYSFEQVQTLEDYYAYLIYAKFVKYREMIPALRTKEYKEVICNFCDVAETRISKVKIGSLIQFINTNFRDIFETEVEITGIEEVSIDIISKYKSGISEACYCYLCDNYGYILIDRFDEFEAVFEKKPSLFDRIFKTGHYVEIQSLREENVYNVFINVCQKKNSSLIQTLDRVLGVLAQDIAEMCNEVSHNNIIFIDRLLRRFYSCLVKIQSPLANKFVNAKKRIEKLVREDLRENGQTFSYEIPTGKIIDMWKSVGRWEVRMISLTHGWSQNADGNLVFHSRLEVDENVRKSIFDQIIESEGSDEHYTHALQRQLEILSAVQGGVFFCILTNGGTYSDFIQMLLNEIALLETSLDCAEENFDTDIRILDSHLKMCLDEGERTKEETIALCYGASMFICALMDKILRTLYLHMSGADKFVAIDKITIGQILNANNQLAKDYFGEKHLRHLAYYLSTDGVKERNIGYNYRNALAHWKINPEIVSPRLVAELLWLLVDIINSITINNLNINETVQDSQ